MNKKLLVMQVKDSKSAMEWLETNSTILKQLLLLKKFRVVTNRYRECDGGNNAARNICSFIEQSKFWSDVPLLIYCYNRKHHDDIVDLTTNPNISVTISYDPSEASNFISWN